MSRKLPDIPIIPNYEYIRNEMGKDLQYRLESRQARTSLGRPLYYRINIQVITTHECPFSCPFCIERQNPMIGDDNYTAQIESLKSALEEHPNAKLTITGGEPGLYPEHVRRLVDIYHQHSNGISCSINTTGFSTELNGIAHIKLSHNDYVQSDPKKFPGCTLQTVLEIPTVDFIKKYMVEMDAESFKFRFLSGFEKNDYDVCVWNDLRRDPEIDVRMFRIGDFFTNATFFFAGKRGQLALGDMWQQQHNDYQDGYSNIIIHPDGHIGTNWR